MKKKFMCLVLSLCMVAGVVTGCGSSEDAFSEDAQEKTVASANDVQEETVASVNDVEVSAEPEEVVYTVSYATLTNIMQKVYNGMDANRRNGGDGSFKGYVANNTTSIGTSEITLTGVSADVPIFSADDVEKLSYNLPRSSVYRDDDNTVVQLISANFPDNLTYKKDSDIALEAIFIIYNRTRGIGEGSVTFVPVRFAMNAADLSDWRIIPEVSDLRPFDGIKYFYRGFEYGVDENFKKIQTSEIPFSQYYISCFTYDRNYMDSRYRYCCVDNDNDPSHPYLVDVGGSDVYEYDAEIGHMIKAYIGDYSLDINEELGADFEGYASVREAVNAYEQGLIRFVDNTWQSRYIHALSGGDDYDYWNMSVYTKFNLIDLNSEDSDDEVPELICTNDAETCFGVYSFDLWNGFACIMSIDTMERNWDDELEWGDTPGTFNIQNGIAYYMSEEIIYIAFPELGNQNIVQYHKYEDGTWSNGSYEELCAHLSGWGLDITIPSPVNYPYDKDSIITAITELMNYDNLDEMDESEFNNSEGDNTELDEADEADEASVWLSAYTDCINENDLYDFAFADINNSGIPVLIYPEGIYKYNGSSVDKVRDDYVSMVYYLGDEMAYYLGDDKSTFLVEVYDEDSGFSDYVIYNAETLEIQITLIEEGATYWAWYYDNFWSEDPDHILDLEEVEIELGSLGLITYGYVVFNVWSPYCFNSVEEAYNYYLENK